MDELTLIQDAIKGDLDSFNRLVLAYQDLAYNVAYRMLGDEAAAEECTQDSFLSAYKHLNTYRGGSFRSWVLRMVTNACYDELRRRYRHPTVPLEPVNEEEDEIEVSRLVGIRRTLPGRSDRGQGDRYSHPALLEYPDP